MKQGFGSFTRNFLKKYGEIDLIAIKKGVTHFVEVKTVSRESLVGVEKEILAEENVTREKLRKLSRVISSYIEKEKIIDWQFDVCAVYVDVNTKKAKIKFIENLLLPEF